MQPSLYPPQFHSNNSVVPSPIYTNRPSAISLA